MKDLSEGLKRIEEFNEYKLISKIYSDTSAKRTKIPYMNHIIEGCRVLLSLKASDEVIKAYCLHPLFQVNKYQSKFLELNGYAYCDKRAMGLAVMYANSANGFLCRPWTDDWTEKTFEKETQFLDMMSECPEDYHDVMLMLLADKLQNQKDFMEHHLYKHERSEELYRYFVFWILYLFNRLGIDQDRLEEARLSMFLPVHLDGSSELSLPTICDRLSKINDICEKEISGKALLDVKTEIMEAIYSAKRMDIKLWENKINKQGDF